MESNQSPFEQWQRPDGAAGSNPQDSIPTSPQAPPPPPSGAFSPPSQSGQQPGQFGAPSPAPGQPSNGHDPYPAAPYAAPNVGMPVPNEPPKKKSKAGVIAAVAAVVALGAGGVFFVTSGRGNAGGADSPEALASQFLDAVGNEDVLGVVDTLLPGERDVARQPLIDFVNELTRLEILAPVDLGSLKGLDVTVQERTIVPEPTNASDITNVAMSGEMELTSNGADVPIGRIIEENVPADAIDEMRRSSETEQVPFDFEITTVQQDGRWYFSLGYTIAEAGRRANGSPDIPETGIVAKGGATPEEALTLTLDRLANLDLRGFIGSFNPGEFGAVQRYAPLFIDDAQAELDRAMADLDANFRFTTPQVRSEINGDVASVFLDAIGIEGDVQGSPFSVSFDGECVHAELEGESFDECRTGFDPADLAPVYEQFPELERLITDATDAFSDMKPTGLQFRRTNGEWYLSPFGTGTEAMLNVLRALDATELQTLIDDSKEFANQFAEELVTDLGNMIPDQDSPFLDDSNDDSNDDSYDGDFSADDTFGDDTASDDTASDDTASDDTASDDTASDDTYGDDTASDDSMSADDGATGTTTPPGPDDDDTASAGGLDEAGVGAFIEVAAACNQLKTYDEASGCLQDAIDEFDIPPYLVPPEYRFPECGRPMFGAQDMSDDEFTQTMKDAAPCFQQLVDSGEIADYEIPIFVRKIDCFEGKNPYTNETDTEYVSRITECFSE